jgi:membrane protease YdiL (CAAX protease family)
MSHSLPEPEPLSRGSVEAGGPPRFPLGIADILVFGVFFGLTIICLPLGMLWILRIFEPGMQFSEVPPELQVLFQGIMDLVLVGFIYFLVRIIHGQSFKECIHWYPNHQFGAGFLIALGATLAVTVLIVSSVFPPSEPPPIERLISSTRALYIFALFGIGVAPLFEEVIFRGFLFRALSDVGGPSVAVPATAALFTLLHIPQLWGSWAGIGLIFAVGYVLSRVRQKSNSLIPGFIIHTAYNAMLFGVFAVSTFVQKGLGNG